MDFGVDAAHMKHRKYNGIQIVLASRDGNISNKIAAIALVLVEDTIITRGFLTVF